MDDHFEGYQARWGVALKAKTKLVIIGGHGQSVATELNGQFEVVGFVDDVLAIGTLVLGYPVLGGGGAPQIWQFMLRYATK